MYKLALNKAYREVSKIENAKELLYCHYEEGFDFELPYFFVRAYVDEGNQEVVIQLAEKKTFDRWANSVNFEERRSYVPGHYYSTFEPQYRWAVKVLKSGLFNFDSYCHVIKLPRFGAKRNRVSNKKVGK